jgi:ribosomal protein S21
MVYVKKQPGDSNDTMIRKFSRKVVQEGIPYEMKKRESRLKKNAFKKFKKDLLRKMSRQMAARS